MKHKKIRTKAGKLQQAATTRLRSLPRRFVVAAAVGAVLLACLFVFALRTAVPITAYASQASAQRIDQPLSLNVGQKIATVDLSRIVIMPKVDGKWRLQRGAPLGSDELIFTPKPYFIAGVTYRVTNIHITRVSGMRSDVPDVTFRTESAPGLARSGLAEMADGTTLAADAVLEVSLTAANRGLRDLAIRTIPQLELERHVLQDKTYQWRPKAYLPQGSKLSVEIYDTKNKASLLKRNVAVAAEPVITSPTDRTRLVAGDTVSLTFNEPMRPEGSKNISFSLPGDGVWKSPTEYVYTPKKLEPGQAYTYDVGAGLRTQKGGILTTKQSGRFSTLGAVMVTGTLPRGSGLAQAAQTVTFTFDQPVNHASAEQRFSVSAGTVTGFSWSGNTLRASVINFGFQRNVTATIAAGVANAGFGLPSMQAFSVGFTTEIRSVKLAVPFYRQQHSGTCSAAALRMALSYRGIGSDEMGLVNAMGYAPRNEDMSTNPPTWDDSSQMFVGSVDGSIAAGTGAGPDAPPVAKAAQAYGRNATAVTGISASWIAQQLYSGNPVLMFGAFRANSGTTSWQTPAGKTIIMNLTGHVTTVIGVSGEPSNPLGFWVNDPLAGATQYWTAGAVSANIARDPDRQAVVVY